MLTRCVAELAGVAALPRPAGQALAGRTVGILGGDPAVRDETATALRRCGARVSVVADDAGAGEQVRAAGRLDALVDLGLTHLRHVAAGAWAPAIYRTYEALAAVAGDWAAERLTGRCTYLTVTSSGGLLGTDPAAISQPLTAIWAGLAKTLPRELPACGVRVLDVDAAAGGPELAAAVAAELAGGCFAEVGWVDGQRYVLLPARREPALAEGLRPLSGDGCVVFSGGGRGIGYHLARHLRLTTGAHVVVTGRTDLDAFDAADLACDDAAFAALRARRLAGARGGEAIRAARTQVEALARARELRRNLDAARRAGAELDYRRCDVTDSASVERLLTQVPGRIQALVHDAGVDHPARLAAKHPESVRSVLSVKVDGFLTLLAALDSTGIRAERICAVGSLTGRYGGTAGQSDYAGANEALARTAQWAGPRRAEPVACLSWPTWDSVGLITNPAAAVREMSPVGVAEGVAAWEQELDAGSRGEVLLLGVPAPLSPPQLSSLPLPSSYPGVRTVLQRRAALGRLVAWRPGEEIETAFRFTADTLPAAAGFLVRGRPSVPASIVLELLLDAASWVAPVPVAALSSVRIDVAALTVPDDGVLELRRRGRVRLADGRSVVDVALSAGTRRVAQACVALRDPEAAAQPAAQRPASAAAAGPGELPVADGPVAWTVSGGLLTRRREGSAWRVFAERRRGSDAYSWLAPPEPVLPAGVVEAFLWGTCPDGRDRTTVVVDRVELGAGAATRCTEGLVDPAAGTATAWDDAGAVVLRVEGLAWTPNAPFPGIEEHLS